MTKDELDLLKQSFEEGAKKLISMYNKMYELYVEDIAEKEVQLLRLKEKAEKLMVAKNRTLVELDEMGIKI